ncbi:DUF5776 domain-containing protein [Apilactobacillus quenuiae]|uniref:DUF5776 domain-containing protein n=1 Tax=Apilactobacillus quenuiae TaxID=2008377 RepID=UPI000D014541|nr:DUF5776 domain-containing protein [Apilactobacillus quenuiae]
MIYNKLRVHKSNDKKILRKVKKQWVTVSISVFALGSAMAVSMYEASDLLGHTINAHAASNNNSKQNWNETNNDTDNTYNIAKKLGNNSQANLDNNTVNSNANTINNATSSNAITSSAVVASSNADNDAKTQSSGYDKVQSANSISSNANQTVKSANNHLNSLSDAYHNASYANYINNSISAYGSGYNANIGNDYSNISNAYSSATSYQSKIYSNNNSLSNAKDAVENNYKSMSDPNAGTTPYDFDHTIKYSYDNNQLKSAQNNLVSVSSYAQNISDSSNSINNIADNTATNNSLNEINSYLEDPNVLKFMGADDAWKKIQSSLAAANSNNASTIGQAASTGSTGSIQSTSYSNFSPDKSNINYQDAFNGVFEAYKDYSNAINGVAQTDPNGAMIHDESSEPAFSGKNLSNGSLGLLATSSSNNVYGYNYFLTNQGIKDAESGKWNVVTNDGNDNSYTPNMNGNAYDQAYLGVQDAMKSQFSGPEFSQKYVKLNANNYKQNNSSHIQYYNIGYNDVVNQSINGKAFVNSESEFETALGFTQGYNIGQTNWNNNVKKVVFTQDINFNTPNNHNTNQNVDVLNNVNGSITIDGQNHIADFQYTSYGFNGTGTTVNVQNFHTIYNANYGPFQMNGSYGDNPGSIHFKNLNYLGAQFIYFTAQNKVNVVIDSGTVNISTNNGYISPWNTMNYAEQESVQVQNGQTVNFIVTRDATYNNFTQNVASIFNFAYSQSNTSSASGGIWLQSGSNMNLKPISDQNYHNPQSTVFMVNGTDLRVDSDAKLNITPLSSNNGQTRFSALQLQGGNLHVNGGTIDINAQYGMTNNIVSVYANGSINVTSPDQQHIGYFLVNTSGTLANNKSVILIDNQPQSGITINNNAWVKVTSNGIGSFNNGATLVYCPNLNVNNKGNLLIQTKGGNGGATLLSANSNTTIANMIDPGEVILDSNGNGTLLGDNVSLKAYSVSYIYNNGSGNQSSYSRYGVVIHNNNITWQDDKGNSYNDNDISGARYIAINAAPSANFDGNISLERSSTSPSAYKISGKLVLANTGTLSQKYDNINMHYKIDDNTEVVVPIHVDNPHDNQVISFNYDLPSLPNNRIIVDAYYSTSIQEQQMIIEPGTYYYYVLHSFKNPLLSAPSSTPSSNDSIIKQDVFHNNDVNDYDNGYADAQNSINPQSPDDNVYMAGYSSGKAINDGIKYSENQNNNRNIDLNYSDKSNQQLYIDAQHAYWSGYNGDNAIVSPKEAYQAGVLNSPNIAINGYNLYKNSPKLDFSSVNNNANNYAHQYSSNIQSAIVSAYVNAYYNAMNASQQGELSYINNPNDNVNPYSNVNFEYDAWHNAHNEASSAVNDYYQNRSTNSFSNAAQSSAYSTAYSTISSAVANNVEHYNSAPTNPYTDLGSNNIQYQAWNQANNALSSAAILGIGKANSSTITLNSSDLTSAAQNTVSSYLDGTRSAAASVYENAYNSTKSLSSLASNNFNDGISQINGENDIKHDFSIQNSFKSSAISIYNNVYSAAQSANDDFNAGNKVNKDANGEVVAPANANYNAIQAQLYEDVYNEVNDAAKNGFNAYNQRNTENDNSYANRGILSIQYQQWKQGYEVASQAAIDAVTAFDKNNGSAALKLAGNGIDQIANTAYNETLKAITLATDDVYNQNYDIKRTNLDGYTQVQKYEYGQAFDHAHPIAEHALTEGNQAYIAVMGMNANPFINYQKGNAYKGWLTGYSTAKSANNEGISDFNDHLSNRVDQFVNKIDYHETTLRNITSSAYNNAYNVTSTGASDAYGLINSKSDTYLGIDKNNYDAEYNAISEGIDAFNTDGNSSLSDSNASAAYQKAYTEAYTNVSGADSEAIRRYVDDQNSGIASYANSAEQSAFDTTSSILKNAEHKAIKDFNQNSYNDNLTETNARLNSLAKTTYSNAYDAHKLGAFDGNILSKQYSYPSTYNQAQIRIYRMAFDDARASETQVIDKAVSAYNNEKSISDNNYNENIQPKNWQDWNNAYNAVSSATSQAIYDVNYARGNQERFISYANFNLKTIADNAYSMAYAATSDGISTAYNNGINVDNKYLPVYQNVYNFANSGASAGIKSIYDSLMKPSDNDISSSQQDVNAYNGAYGNARNIANTALNAFKDNYELHQNEVNYDNDQYKVYDNVYHNFININADGMNAYLKDIHSVNPYINNINGNQYIVWQQAYDAAKQALNDYDDQIASYSSDGKLQTPKTYNNAQAGAYVQTYNKVIEAASDSEHNYLKNPENLNNPYENDQSGVQYQIWQQLHDATFKGFDDRIKNIHQDAVNGYGYNAAQIAAYNRNYATASNVIDTAINTFNNQTASYLNGKLQAPSDYNDAQVNLYRQTYDEISQASLNGLNNYIYDFKNQVNPYTNLIQKQSWQQTYDAARQALNDYNDQSDNYLNGNLRAPSNYNKVQVDAYVKIYNQLSKVSNDSVNKYMNNSGNQVNPYASNPNGIQYQIWQNAYGAVIKGINDYNNGEIKYDANGRPSVPNGYNALQAKIYTNINANIDAANNEGVKAYTINPNDNTNPFSNDPNGVDYQIFQNAYMAAMAGANAYNNGVVNKAGKLAIPRDYNSVQAGAYVAVYDNTSKAAISGAAAFDADDSNNPYVEKDNGAQYAAWNNAYQAAEKAASQAIYDYEYGNESNESMAVSAATNGRVGINNFAKSAYIMATQAASLAISTAVDDFISNIDMNHGQLKLTNNPDLSRKYQSLAKNAYLDAYSNIIAGYNQSIKDGLLKQNVSKQNVDSSNIRTTVNNNQSYKYGYDIAQYGMLGAYDAYKHKQNKPSADFPVNNTTGIALKTYQRNAYKLGYYGGYKGYQDGLNGIENQVHTKYPISNNLIYVNGYDAGYINGQQDISVNETPTPLDIKINYQAGMSLNQTIFKDKDSNFINAYQASYDSAQKGFYDTVYHAFDNKNNDEEYHLGHRAGKNYLDGVNDVEHHRAKRSHDYNYDYGYNAYQAGHKLGFDDISKYQINDLLLGKSKAYKYAYMKGYRIGKQQYDGIIAGKLAGEGGFANSLHGKSSAYAKEYRAAYKKERLNFPMYVYSTSRMFKYRSYNFNHKNLLKYYKAGPRNKAKTFKITGIIRKPNGNTICRLSDRTFIVTRKINEVYYRDNSINTVKVIRDTGIRMHSNKNFSDANVVRNIQYGEKISIEKVVKLGHITRFKLENGNYITSNKTCVKVIN